MKFSKPFFEGKNRFVQILFLLVFVLGGVLIFSALGELIAYLVYHTLTISEAPNPGGFVRISQTFSSIGLFLIPSLLFAYGQDKQWFHYNALDQKPHNLLIDAVLLLSIAILPVVALLSQWNQSIQLPDSMANMSAWMKKTEETATQLMSYMTTAHTYPVLFLNLFVMAILPAICEEFMFQGTIQVFLTKWIKKPHVAIWLTAVIFSFIHFEFNGFIPRLLLGAYLGYLFYWSKSLWLPILAHFLHNALSVLIDFTFQGRGINVDDVKFTSVHGAIPLVITCALMTIMGLVFMWRIQRDVNEGKIPKGGNNRKI